MFSKFFSAINALLVVMITILPSNKVEAQALVEFALILGVFGFNTNEKAEIYWRTNPASPQSEGGVRFNPDGQVFFYMDVTDTANSNCTQSIQTPKTTKPVTIAISHVEYSEGELVISSSTGDEEIREPLDPCFDGRIVVQLGVPIPPAREDEIFRQLGSNPSAPVAGMPRISGFSISDAVSGDTKTQSIKWSGESVVVPVLDSGID